MSYNKKMVNKLSITKKSSWSLVLAAKEMIDAEENHPTLISIEKIIRGTKYNITYDSKSEAISECNFIIDDYNKMLFSTFLPIIFNNHHGPFIIAHLAQTLDGFIATDSGESKYISSKENLTHIHMMRAISDVIIVGHKTVTLDNPELTTRLVKGPSPMRIIIDKNNKLSNKYKVFKNSDSNGYKVINDKIQTNENNIFQLPLDKDQFNTKDICLLLKKLRKKIIFIEGGGATVSDFYNRNSLNRLHLCISPIILGQGRPSFITKMKKTLDEAKCHETKYFQMGQDILCDIKVS